MQHQCISLHQLKVYQCLAAHERWMTNAEIVHETGVVPRTVRHHTRLFVASGIAEEAALFPQRAYRLSAEARQGEVPYLGALARAQEVFAALTA